MTKFQIKMSNIQSPKRGLVLEGGGAKGAWQFGVIQALVKHGVNFSVVSGTSIGALNGAILATGRLDVGERFMVRLCDRRRQSRESWRRGIREGRRGTQRAWRVCSKGL